MVRGVVAKIDSSNVLLFGGVKPILELALSTWPLEMKYIVLKISPVYWTPFVRPLCAV